MNMNEIIKNLPKEKIRADPELKALYNYLKEVFTGEKSPANINPQPGGSV